ncbi:hypothetical protein MGG_15039 [Pyricularia oryzae 70-15]|uniref:Uncharacterized protein n=1 Tax=Pyricularia oryzae (strain 70-15 / ATCC MYA-4617 / FGSC 8958) TaxID=242507 RepID=G4NKJ9_PYRO7|nr:uncharacterized protein MGG_15039 [Pyricularia oryzae 70-15]EHA45874.1 hypothetical protein MGG_15039 [Pyricularia oryzae 70-15]
MQRNAAEREENAARFELVGTVQGAPTTQRKTPMLDNAALGPDIVVECDVCAFRLLEKEARFWKTDPQFYVAKEQGVQQKRPLDEEPAQVLNENACEPDLARECQASEIPTR